MDGPVGEMINKMGRHPNRPGHIHAMVYADGYVPVTTHLFPSDSPYLDSDAVFGVRNSLIVDFEKKAPGTAPEAVMNAPALLLAPPPALAAPTHITPELVVERAGAPGESAPRVRRAAPLPGPSRSHG